MTTVVVFGGAGFLGRRLVHRLATEGMTVRVAMRHPDPLRIELRSMSLDRVTVAPADVRDQASVAAAIAGANAVVNTVSAYAEKGGVTFEAVHVHGAETVAREAVAAGIARLVLVSGIGADPDSGSPYIRISVLEDAANWWSRRRFRGPRSSARALCSVQATPYSACSPTSPGRFRCCR